MLPTGSAYAAFEELRPQEMTGYSDIPVGLVSAYDVLSPQEAEAMLRRSTAYSVVDPTAAAHAAPSGLPSLASSALNPLTQAQSGLLTSYGRDGLDKEASNSKLTSYGDTDDNAKLQAYGDSAPKADGSSKLEAYMDQKPDVKAESGLLTSYASESIEKDNSSSKLSSYGDTKSAEPSADNKLSGYSSLDSSAQSNAPTKPAASKTPATKAAPPPGPPKSKYITEHVRDWNAEFQKAVDMEPSPQKFLLLKSVALDFVETAKLYGRVRNEIICARNLEHCYQIIISEARLPVSEKSIPPVAIGGVAGGEKFITQGILFKFAIDQPISPDKKNWMYGGAGPADHLAMKAASHELKGNLNIYHKSEESNLQLSLPLIALVDYRGYRLLASSIIPITKDTLKLGSSDAGVTFHHEDPVLFDTALRLGARLGLAQHGTVSLEVVIATPGDLEGHKGLDGRYYLLDVARLFPPEAPLPGNKRAIYYNLLRAEFVLKYKEPLSSDAFAGWGSLDPKASEYNQAVRDATAFLRTELVQQVAAEIDRAYDLSRQTFHENQAEFGAWLARVLHMNGVNLRYLGLVRSHSRHVNARKHLLAEMIARIVKINIKRLQRQNVTRSGVTAHVNVIVDELNTLIGHRAQSMAFWHSEIKAQLLEKYGAEALSATEKNPHLHLANVLLLERADSAKINMGTTIYSTTPLHMEDSSDFYIRLMVSRIESLLGMIIRISPRFDGVPPRAMSSLLPSYIDPDTIRVKHSNIVDYYEGVMMDELGSRLCQDGAFVEGRELLKKALESFLVALSAASASISLLIRIARLELKLATLIPTTGKKFIKIFSLFNSTTTGLLQFSNERLRTLVGEHLKVRMSKVQLMRERATERMQIARKILHGTRLLPSLTASMALRQYDIKAKLHFVRGEAMLELARSHTFARSAQTMLDSVRQFRKALKSPHAIREFLPDLLSLLDRLLRAHYNTPGIDRGPEGTPDEQLFASFIKLQVAELIDPGSLVATKGIVFALLHSLARVNYGRWKMMRSGMFENSQLPATLDDEAALMWMLGVKAEKILSLDRTALDTALVPWGNFAGAYSCRFFLLMPDHPQVATRIRQLLAHVKRVAPSAWNIDVNYDMRVGFPNMIAAHTSAEELFMDPTTKMKGCSDVSLWEGVIQQMSRIKVFTIRQIPFPPETCALLAASCTQLVSLAIDCPYSQADDYLLPLTQLTKLTHLSCEFLPCPDMVLETLLSALPSLSSLYLQAVQYQSEEVGQAFLRKGGKLLSLGIRDLESVTLKTFDEIQRGCTQLTRLVMQSLRYTDCNAMVAIGKMTTLRSLQIEDLLGPKDDGAAPPLDCCRFSSLAALSLTEMHIVQCDYITDLDIAALADSIAPKLRRFKFHHRSVGRLNPECVAAMLAKCSQLVWLKVISISTMDGNALLKVIGAGLTRLEELEFSIAGIEEAAYVALAAVTSLRSLSIPGKEKTQTIRPLSALTNLELLEAGGMNLDPESLYAIGSLTNLKALAMVNSPFSDNHLAMLAKLTKLTHMNVRLCPLNFDSTQVLLDLPRLQYLWINLTTLHFRSLHLLDAARFRLWNMQRSMDGKCRIELYGHGFDMSTFEQLDFMFPEWR